MINDTKLHSIDLFRCYISMRSCIAHEPLFCLCSLFYVEVFSARNIQPNCILWGRKRPTRVESHWRSSSDSHSVNNSNRDGNCIEFEWCAYHIAPDAKTKSHVHLGLQCALTKEIKQAIAAPTTSSYSHLILLTVTENLTWFFIRCVFFSLVVLLRSLSLGDCLFTLLFIYK